MTYLACGKVQLEHFIYLLYEFMILTLIESLNYLEDKLSGLFPWLILNCTCCQKHLKLMLD